MEVNNGDDKGHADLGSMPSTSTEKGIQQPWLDPLFFYFVII